MKKILLGLIFFPIFLLAQEVNLENGLVAHYSFDGNAKDISANHNNGILPSSGVKFTSGKVGKAVNFYSASHIRVPNNSSLKFYNEVSFSVWVKTNSSKGQAIFAKRHDRSGFYAYTNYKDGKLNAMLGNNVYSSPKFTISASINSKNNSWVHVVYVISKNKAQIYLNGKLAKTESNLNINFNIANNNDLYIGKFNDSWYPFTGTMDEFRIYNKTLNRTEVEALYDNSTSNRIAASNSNLVVYQDKQINDEASFTLFDENISYNDLEYSEKTAKLYLLMVDKIIEYDLSNIQSEKPTKREIIITDMYNESRPSGSGIEINDEGSKLAYIDAQKFVHIIDLTTFTEIFKKSIKKLST